MRFFRVLLLALFAAGQGALAFHYHAAPEAGFGGKAAVSGKTQAAPEAQDCRLCTLSAQSRFGNVSAAAVVAVSIQAVAIVSGDPFVLVSPQRIRLSDRAPPAC